MTSAILRLLLRSMIAVGLLTWLTLSQDVDWAETLSRLASIRPASLVIAIVAVAGSHVLAIESVRRLLRNRGFEVHFAKLMANHFRGLFVSQFLPTPVAGDIVRVHDIHRRHSSSASSLVQADEHTQTDRPERVWQAFVWALTTQRALNLIASLLIFVMAVQVAEIQDLTVLQTAAFSILLAAACGFALVAAAPQLAASSIFKKVLSWVPRLRAVLRTLAFGIAQQAALIVAVLAMANGLGIDVSTSRLVAAVPLSLLAVILPVSVSGLGVRESVYVFVLGPAGVSASDAVTLSLSIFGLAFIFSVLGLASPGRVTTESESQPHSPAMAGSSLKDQPTS